MQIGEDIVKSLVFILTVGSTLVYYGLKKHNYPFKGKVDMPYIFSEYVRQQV